MTIPRTLAVTAMVAVVFLAGCSGDDHPAPDPDDSVYQPRIYYYDGPSPGFVTFPPATPTRRR
ncbi:hypothetical protein [Embleya hyalina]|uniref:hypothetical protein n=1 Tax=Embleya hyalina TaxID=516124 RepID=UPI000F81E3C9|nr:hypothetical protein [Embleya hyalina]